MAFTRNSTRKIPTTWTCCASWIKGVSYYGRRMENLYTITFDEGFKRGAIEGTYSSEIITWIGLKESFQGNDILRYEKHCILDVRN